MDNATKYIKSVYVHTLDAKTINLINEGIEHALKDAEHDSSEELDNLIKEVEELERDISWKDDEIEQLKTDIFLLENPDIK